MNTPDIRVKVKRYEKKSFWYSDRIGEEFWVKQSDERNWVVVAPSSGSLLRKTDCEIVVNKITRPKIKLIKSDVFEGNFYGRTDISQMNLLPTPDYIAPITSENSLTFVYKGHITVVVCK